MLFLSFLLAKIRDTDAHRLFDNHDFRVSEHRPTHENVDVVAGRTGDRDHAPRPQFQNLGEGHDSATEFHVDVQWDVCEIGDLIKRAHACATYLIRLIVVWLSSS